MPTQQVAAEWPLIVEDDPPREKRVHVVEEDDDLGLILPDGSTSSSWSITGDVRFLEEAEVQAPGSQEKVEEDLESPWPSPRTKLYGDKQSTASFPVPDPNEIIKMMAELTLAKERLEERTAKVSNPHPNMDDQPLTRAHLPPPIQWQTKLPGLYYTIQGHFQAEKMVRRPKSYPKA